MTTPMGHMEQDANNLVSSAKSIFEALTAAFPWDDCGSYDAADFVDKAEATIAAVAAARQWLSDEES